MSHPGAAGALAGPLAAARGLVLGVGNRLGGDDAVGPLVCDRLRARLGLGPTDAPDDPDALGVPDGRAGERAGLRVEALAGAPIELSARWGPDDAVVLVDAARSGAAPGHVHRFDALAGPLPADVLAVSTHALGVAAGIELGRALGRLPRRLVVLAVEGARFEPGAAPTPAVLAVVDRVADLALRELLDAGGAGAPDAQEAGCTSTG